MDPTTPIKLHKQLSELALTPHTRAIVEEYSGYVEKSSCNIAQLT